MFRAKGSELKLALRIKVRLFLLKEKWGEVFYNREVIFLQIFRKYVKHQTLYPFTFLPNNQLEKSWSKKY